ncbi:MAG: class I SAM-dependent methyltransferase [Nitrospirae bacterium]|nr:class I SAM-dependent methyltransferase [Magnetococcales bacterium]
MSGYPSHRFFNIISAQFTTFMVQDRIIGDYGFSLQEIQFIEGFSEFLAPETILVIGNAHGWSTVALALIFPHANVVAIDTRQEGITFTNTLARKNRLNIIAVQGRSPDDVQTIFTNHCTTPLDLIVIDADHHIDSIVKDFFAVQSLMKDDGILLFHDIIDHGLMPGFLDILKNSKMHGRLLTRTSSGIGIAFRQIQEDFLSYINCFNDNPDDYHRYVNLMAKIAGVERPC